jgi:hypothetical protein
MKEEDFKLLPFALCLLPSLQLIRKEEKLRVTSAFCPLPYAFTKVD